MAEFQSGPVNLRMSLITVIYTDRCYVSTQLNFVAASYNCWIETGQVITSVITELGAVIQFIELEVQSEPCETSKKSNFKNKC